MSENEEKAKELFISGYNCAQSVLGVYAEKFGIDFKTAMKLSSSFGGGMGRLREVCGAVSAMFMIAGLANGYSTNDCKTEKTQHYKRIQHLAKEFENLNGSIICRELLKLSAKTDTPEPSDRNEKYYTQRPCLKFVSDACLILDKYFARQNLEENKI